MKAALRELMTGLVDYAGLFPPAGLDMTTAAENYAAYRAGAHRWMLGTFILPAGRLSELADDLPARATTADPWPLSLLVGGGEPAEITATLANQNRAVADFLAAVPGLARVTALEAPLPVGLDRPALDRYLTAFQETLADGGPADARLYLEIPAAGDDDLGYLAAVAATGAGAKIRMGGVVPEAFPPVDRVARILDRAAALDLPVKFTAGLHHPVRHLAKTPPVVMHGFLNVFVAALLAGTGGTGPSDLAAVLAETDPARFRCGELELGWGEHRLPVAGVTARRRAHLPGFGSCSFTEPLADLAALDLL